jgi:hypothetical protein
MWRLGLCIILFFGEMIPAESTDALNPSEPKLACEDLLHQQGNPGELTLLEFRVMLTVAIQDPNAYGTSVITEIERRTGRKQYVGPIYSSLRHLARAGLISASKTAPSGKCGGRAKTVYTITPEGREKLQNSLDAIDGMRRGTGF